jgi:hypothetical protein
MGGLGRGVDDTIRLQRFDQGEDSCTVPDIEFVMREAGDEFRQAGLVPAGVALSAKEDGALVVVYTVDGAALLVEMKADFRADQAGGSRD